MRIPIVKILLNKDIDWNAHEKNGETIYAYAKAYHKELIEKHPTNPSIAFFNELLSFFLDYAQIRKSARILAQGLRPQSDQSLVNRLAKDSAIHIAALTATSTLDSDNLMNEELATKIATKYLCKPS